MREISHSVDWNNDAAKPASGSPNTTMQWLLGAAALLLAAMLLASFYNVTQQSVARAHLHWADAVQQSTGCSSTARGDDRCGDMTVRRKSTVS